MRSLNLYNKHEIKPLNTDGKARREQELRERLTNALNGKSISSIAQATKYNPETVRRYFQGVGKIPADFIGLIIEIYNLNPHLILTGYRVAPELEDLYLATTEILINELGRRIQMIEDCAVGTVLRQTD